jgi:hypothetical protein
MTAAEWTTLNKKRTVRIRVELAGGKREYEVWLDPSVNWLVRRCKHVIRDGDGTFIAAQDYHVQEFAEIEPSFYVPAVSKNRVQYKELPTTEHVARIKNARVNKTLPQQPAWPRLPEGSMAIDELSGRVYPVDAAGDRIGPGRKVRFMDIEAESRR